jgi:hypothetical protein
MYADKETNRECIRLRQAFGATGRRIDANGDRLHEGGPEGDAKLARGNLSPSSVSFCVNKDFIRVYSCPFAVEVLFVTCRAEGLAEADPFAV